MSTCPASLVAAASLGAAVLLLASGCSSTRPRPESVLVAPAQRVPVKRVVQVSYGADATFAVCLEPACPKVTPKTLALQNMAAARASSAANAGVAGTAAWPATARAEPGASPSQVVVTFASGSAVLTTGAKAVLSSALARHGAARRITVAGHTDSTGSASLNKALATARAKAVLGFLVVQALSPKPAVEVEAQGACCFTAPNDSEAGRLRNRRVEVTFYGQGA